MTGADRDMAAVAADRVAQGDQDRFAALMATPADLRARLWPVHAVALEIARAAWVSAEPMIGEMRLQWWVDALSALEDRGIAPSHEIGSALARETAAPLREIAEARRLDCWRAPFADLAALQDYLAATGGALHAAAGAAIGADAAEQTQLRRYGTAAAAASWLMALPETEARGWEGMPEGDLARLAQEALRDLAAAEAQLARASRGARAAMLPGWRTEAVLKRALSNPARIRQGLLGGSEFSRRFSLLRATLRLR